LEAWRPVLCFLLRWPWPEGAGIVADCSPSRAPLAMKTTVPRPKTLRASETSRLAESGNPFGDRSDVGQFDRVFGHFRDETSRTVDRFDRGREA